MLQMVKMGVQYSLWGGSVVNLGTERHREKYFDDIDSFRLPGCFAMTELRHGSNVAGLQTEACLDVAADEWDVHTPDEGAIKVGTLFLVFPAIADHARVLHVPAGERDVHMPDEGAIKVTFFFQTFWRP